MIVSYNNKIKLWDIFSWENLLTLNNINKENKLYSACFLNYNNQTYIVSSNGDFDLEGKSEKIKVFDFNGEKVKEINNSDNNTFFIDTYFDKNKSKFYIITGNINCVNSFDYENNSLYHKYSSNTFGEHVSVIIYEKENITNMIESCNNDIYIRIWDFHTGFILNKHTKQ
jgi:WD40 repeat protein